MINAGRSLPAASATAWLIDLTGVGGPRFCVMRRSEAAARGAMAHHLVDIGAVESRSQAEELVARAVTDSVAVIW